MNAALRWLAALVLASFVAAALLACAGGDRPPVRRSDGLFVYPQAARSAGQEGYVRVRFDVDAEGRVGNARVEAEAPPGVFGDAALAYVQSWRYLPARRAGVAVAAPAQTARIEFRVGEAQDYPDAIGP